MDFNIEIRKKQLDNLDQLITSSRDRIKSVLNYLGWSSENVEKEDVLVQCPINQHHRIDPKSWQGHIEQCLVRAEGYNVKNQFLSEPIESSSQSIYLDRNKKIELITKELSEKGALRLAWNGFDPDPRTADRLVSTFSSDERLVFYNYSVANTVGPPPPPEFTTLHDKKRDEEKSLSYEELLAQERDSKRRRVKYKSVHINRKKHTEVIREVINGQMEDYKEWLSAKNQKGPEEGSTKNGFHEKDDQERPNSSISRNSNSSSSRSSRRHRRESSRDGRYKSRHRDPKEESRHRRRYSRESDRRRDSRERNHRH